MPQLIKAICAGFLYVPLSIAGTAENYCHDPAVDADWERLIMKYEGDAHFTYLYGLREELCADVDAGRLSLGQAIKRFEAERAQIIRERHNWLERQGAAAVGTG